MRVNSVLETALYVTDLPAAEKFYTQVLGLELYSREEGRHAFFRLGNAMLLLFNPGKTRQATGLVPTHGADGPGHVAFTLNPADIEAWREQLAQHSVPIETEVRWPNGGFSIYFRDPANNSVELATPQMWGLSLETGR